MSNSKQHHFVPIWYLNRFSDKSTGFLDVYDKHTKCFRKQKPNKVMKINQYYKQKWAPEGIDPNILELFAGEFLEPKAKAAFERVLTMPVDFTPEETAVILIYIEFQRIRVPRQANLAKSIIESSILTGGDPDLLTLFLQGKVKISDSARFEFMKQATGKIIPYLTRMRWDIVKAPAGSSFITTDSPVSLYNVDFLPPTEPGLKYAGTKVIFPLSSELLLIMRHPEYDSDPLVKPRTLVPEPCNRNWDINITFYPDHVDSSFVNYQNWLLCEQADRTIAGNCRAILQNSLFDPKKME